MDKPVVKQGQDQREALNDAERRAERERPQNYQQEETEDKIVEVLPIDGDSTPIQSTAMRAISRNSKTRRTTPNKLATTARSFRPTRWSAAELRSGCGCAKIHRCKPTGRTWLLDWQ